LKLPVDRQRHIAEDSDDRNLYHLVHMVAEEVIVEHRQERIGVFGKMPAELGRKRRSHHLRNAVAGLLYCKFDDD
jgi:hypothetical protein